MSKMRNRIITISGEPASGKSTVIEELRKYYEEIGLRVHVLKIGNEFRKLALERGLTLEQFSEYVSARSSIDEYLDSKVAEKGREINLQERPDEVFIFDSRLAFHNIPDSFSIRLVVDDNVAGRRVFQDSTRGPEDRYNTLEEAIKQTKKRKESEIERYIQRYGVNLQEPDNYNLLVDTSFSDIRDISELIASCLELELQDKPYAKTWISPKKLLPLQTERETLGRASYTFDEMVKIIREEGYNPTCEIATISVDAILYIIEGHHRNFASGYLGETLVPYSVIAKDDEFIPGTECTARERAGGLQESFLWGHEEFFDKEIDGNRINFSYNQIYPGIYNRLRGKEMDR